MNNLIELENRIWSLGFFAKQVKLNITLESEFEGFYGKASEDWEKRVCVEIISPDEEKIKSVKIVGRRFERINDVAGRALSALQPY